MSPDDDGHGPRYGCAYAACGNPAADRPCPFVRDEPVAVVSLNTPPGHEHEWRQLIVDRSWDAGLVDWHVPTFYCVHCLTIKNLATT